MLFAAFALALILALLLTPLAIRLAWNTGYLDHPEARKLHASATALLGGLAVALATVFAWIVVLRADGRLTATPGNPLLGLVAGGAISLLWGLWDDRFGMGVRVKLFGQLLAGLCLVGGGAIPDLGLPIWIEALLVLFGMIAALNAVNFLDNMNGMVAGWTAIAMLAFAFGSIERGALGLAALQLALAGACAGFLPYNFPNAKVFLGDAGSLFLGYSLAASTVLGLSATPAGWGRIGFLFPLAYPAFDMIFVVVNRLREGREFYKGGKDHSNHRLARWIRCPTRTVKLLWLSGAVLCASGVVVQNLNRRGPTLLLSGLWTILFLWMGARLSSVPSEAR
jgi:UDP-GlcNAc:undecaprenyl-phosphate GlcNAc-1-phosphate transferase